MSVDEIFDSECDVGACTERAYGEWAEGEPWTWDNPPMAWHRMPICAYHLSRLRRVGHFELFDPAKEKRDRGV